MKNNSKTPIVNTLFSFYFNDYREEQWVSALPEELSQVHFSELPEEVAMVRLTFS